MSRFDDELIKQAENAYQQRVGEGAVTTPRQEPYNQVDNLNLDGPFGLSSQAPAPAEEVADWIANQPATRLLEVRDLDAADPADNSGGEIIGGPGSSAVYAEGGPMYASKVNPIDDSLYNVYKASREIRDAIVSQTDFDFSNLITASSDAATVLRFASANNEINEVVGTVAAIVLDIENELATNGDYKQASADLVALEGLLEDINKVASSDNVEQDEEDNDGDDEVGTTSSKKKDKKKCTCDGDGSCKACKKSKKKEATNGNQETLQVIDVRDLDDQAGVFDRDRLMGADHKTNVLVPEEVNGEDAGYVPFYNDGAETGITPGEEPNKQVVWPNDGTNPAYVPYQQGTVAAVQASREKIFESLQIVERLEKLGMVNNDDRAKHIAKFEQMSDAKLAGFKASLDMLEESGARQPRSQKVASGSNRMPEMGRLTTASTVTRQDIKSDDWLMTL
jgi:hypothetical protein